MMRPTRAVVSRDPEQPPRIEEIDLGDPRPDEVVVEVAAAALCHTDLSCHQGAFGTPKPIALGHEGAGTVVEVGAAVTTLAVGDHVVLAAASCGACRSCLTGRPAYCARAYELNMLGNRPDGSSAYNGSDVRSHFLGQSSMATFAIACERSVVKIGDDVPFELAAPLGCGIMTGAGTVLNSLSVRPGSTVAVFGAGAVGLSALMAAFAARAAQAIAVDVVPARLELASELGATAVVNAAAEDPIEALRELSGGGVDYTVEASGTQAGLRAAIESLGLLGRCAIVGAAGHGAEGAFDWMSLQIKGAAVQGVLVGDAVAKTFIPELLAMQARGVLPFERMITVYQGLDEVAQAIEDAETGRVVKPVLRLP